VTPSAPDYPAGGKSLLAGKVVLVTAAAGTGIGFATAKRCAEEGAVVAISDKHERRLAESAAELGALTGSPVVAVPCDVTVEDDVQRMFGAVIEAHGGIDVLVNNAGIWRGAPVEEISDDDWREMLDINLTGTFHCIRAAVPAMKAAGAGRIVNVSSTAGQRGEALHAHYAATKGAVISLTKSLAAELAPHGITVNCVAPGWVATDMTADSLAGPDREGILSAIPLGRVATPEEIAGAVLFLASDLASFVTGEILNVNGGAVLCG